MNTGILPVKRFVSIKRVVKASLSTSNNEKNKKYDTKRLTSLLNKIEMTREVMLNPVSLSRCIYMLDEIYETAYYVGKDYIELLEHFEAYSKQDILSTGSAETIENYHY